MESYIGSWMREQQANFELCSKTYDNNILLMFFIIIIVGYIINNGHVHNCSSSNEIFFVTSDAL